MMCETDKIIHKTLTYVIPAKGGWFYKPLNHGVYLFFLFFCSMKSCENIKNSYCIYQNVSGQLKDIRMNW